MELNKHKGEKRKYSLHEKLHVAEVAKRHKLSYEEELNGPKVWDERKKGWVKPTSKEAREIFIDLKDEPHNSTHIKTAVKMVKRCVVASLLIFFSI